jgi:regulator of replication initiation timing
MLQYLLYISAMESLSALDIQALREAVARSEMRAAEAEAEAARVKAINADLTARNAHLELQNEKMRRALHGPSSERTRRLIDQMELIFEELEATATEDEIAAQQAAAKVMTVEGFVRKRVTRRDLGLSGFSCAGGRLITTPPWPG